MYLAGELTVLPFYIFFICLAAAAALCRLARWSPPPPGAWAQRKISSRLGCLQSEGFVALLPDLFCCRLLMS
jgi:hypothetical protein